jgi:hypothetical protein
MLAAFSDENERLRRGSQMLVRDRRSALPTQRFVVML